MVVTRIKSGKFYEMSNRMPIHHRHLITWSYVPLLVVQTEHCGNSEEIVNICGNQRGFLGGGDFWYGFWRVRSSLPDAEDSSRAFRLRQYFGWSLDIKIRMER